MVNYLILLLHYTHSSLHSNREPFRTFFCYELLALTNLDFYVRMRDAHSKFFASCQSYDVIHNINTNQHSCHRLWAELVSRS